MMKARNNYTPEFKAKVVLEILSEVETVNQIAAKYEISPVVLSRWKKEFLERAAEVFKKGPSAAEKELGQSKEHIAELERKVGQLTYCILRRPTATDAFTSGRSAVANGR